MAMQISSRSLLSRTLVSSLLSRTFSSRPASSSPRPISLLRSALRPLCSGAAKTNISIAPNSPVTHSFSTRATTSSLNDPSPNWSNRPPKEVILLDGCDFEHWLVVVEKPDENMTRDEIIDSYIKTLAKVVGSEEEARMKIYSVSTRHYFAFGALVPEDLSNKIKELPGVRWVLPDSYLDVRNKDYGGEPFINGQAVPYDPKYHEEWVRNNAKANERNKRPRVDRPRNFERRRENMQSRDGFGNQGMQNSSPNMSSPVGPPPNAYAGRSQNNMGGPNGPMNNNYSGRPPYSGPGGPGGPQYNNNVVGGGMPQNSFGGMPQNNMGGMPPNNAGGMPPNNMSGMPPNNAGGMPPNNAGGMPPHNVGGMPPNNAGGMPSNAGWSNSMPGNMQNFQNGPHAGGMPYQGAPGNYQNEYSQGRDGSMPGANQYPA